MTMKSAPGKVLILIAMSACNLCQAQEYAGGRAAQDEPIRRRSVVEATGQRIIDQYSDRLLAQYGILDVTKLPYSADPTGKHDSTHAIQQAIKDARDARLVTFFPGGTYRVSETLTCTQGVVTRDRWMFGHADPSVENESYYFPCVLMGARDGQRSRITLARRSPGFDDPRKPRPLIHFWARAESGASADPSQPEPAISFNQMIVDLDLSLGNNPGAVGIDHQGAQGSVIEDVTVDATGAFAGIQRAPGSGGGIHGLTVFGGRYGLFLRGDPSFRGTQPVPIASNVTLKGQTELAILYDGRGPLTVVGALIEGGGVLGDSQEDLPWYGSMNFIDTVFRPRKDSCVIRSNHSVYLSNVYVERGQCIASVDGGPQLRGQMRPWDHIREYALGARVKYPEWLKLDAGIKQDATYIDGESGPARQMVEPLIDSNAPPLDIQARHAWSPLPSWRDAHVANVRDAPYDAKGDGLTDDAAAIQHAIDESDAVFLPKGEYKLSRPLILRSRTRLFGVSGLLSVLSPMDSGSYLDARHPAPLIDTVDDPEASTTLAFVELRVPAGSPSVYALRWRAGRNSVVRNIHPIATFWSPDALPIAPAMIQIEGSGGGRWFDLAQWHWWAQGPAYRHLLVEGTHEPLSFYMLNPEHAGSEAQVEFRDAQNISVYSLKSEDFFTLLWMRSCRGIHIYGYGGLTAPRPNWPVFRIEHSSDTTLANVDPQLFNPSVARQLFGTFSRDILWLDSDPKEWVLISDSAVISGVPVELHGVEQVVLYKRSNASPSQ